MNNALLLSLMDSLGGPFYALDEKVLRSRVSFLRSHLPSKVKLCYAVKANPFILPELRHEVERFEICSPGELHICQTLGLDPKKFVVSGVHKDERMVTDLVFGNVNIGRYTVESKAQFDRLSHIAQERKTRISLLLRLTSGNQFGLDERTVKDLFEHYHRSAYLDIQGIQFFSGTQKTSLKRLKREVDHLDSFAQMIERECGYRTLELEYGPGLPVAYFDSDEFDERSYLGNLSSMLTNMQFKGALVLEVGRSLAATCGTYLTKVVDLKENEGQRYAIVDGGMHHLVYYGQSMAMRQPPCRLLSNRKEGDVHDWTVCGSLCTVNDILIKRLPLQGLRRGDVIAFEKVGAYCMTECAALFLSRALPTIVMIDRVGQPHVVREAINIDFINTPWRR